MNKQEAIQFLTEVLPFGDYGQDFQTKFGDKILRNMDEFITHLEEDFGEFTIDAYDSENNTLAIVYIDSNAYETLFKTPAPFGFTLKVMEALYIIIP